MRNAEMRTAQPILSTPRLRLVPAAPGDLAWLHELWSEPSVREFLFDGRPVDRELAERVLNDCLGRSDAGQGLWLVHLVDEPDQPEPVGFLGLSPTTVVAEADPSLAGLLEPAVALAPRWRHRGLALEALRALLAHAFDTLQLPCLAAANDVPNAASERMLLAAGFHVQREVPGPKYRLRTYTLTSPQWRGLAR